MQAKQVALPEAPAAPSEEKVVEITGPQSTADIFDLLGQASTPVAKPTPAAAASTDPLLGYLQARPKGSIDAEALAEQKAAEEALKNPDLAEMVKRQCNL